MLTMIRGLEVAILYFDVDTLMLTMMRIRGGNWWLGVASAHSPVNHSIGNTTWDTQVQPRHSVQLRPTQNCVLKHITTTKYKTQSHLLSCQSQHWIHDLRHTVTCPKLCFETLHNCKYDCKIQDTKSTTQLSITAIALGPSIPHICHIVHMWDMWRKICHVEKFQISIHGQWGEIW